MRILHVTPYFAPAFAFGGPVTVADLQVRALVEAGHEVTVATTDALDPSHRIRSSEPPEWQGARVVRFPNVSHGLAARAMLWTPRGWGAWIDQNASAFDVLHLHDLYSVLSVRAARAGRPFLLQPHGSVAPTRERGRAGPKAAFLALWGRESLRRAAAVLYATEDEQAEILHQAPSARTQFSPPPFALPDPGPVARESPPVVAYLGRIDPIKRLDVLVDAIALARRTVPGLRLRIIGPADAYAGELRAQIARRDLAGAVEMPGPLYGAEKARALAGATVFALLSRSEGLPVAALEAMSLGIPSVLTPECHLPDVDGNAGRVVPGTAAAAAAAITELVEDAAVHARAAEGARRLAAGYGADAVLPRLLEIYAQVVS